MAICILQACYITWIKYIYWSNFLKNENDLPLPLTTEWRIFWIALNTSYVMEFFLNSLVKRGVLSQRYMMILNGLLMCSASLAAICAVNSVRLEAAVLSLLFNFGNRGHDVINTLVVGCIVSYIWAFNSILPKISCWEEIGMNSN